MGGHGELMLTILTLYAQAESRSVFENRKWRICMKYERGSRGPPSPPLDIPLSMEARDRSGTGLC
jgi:DNA invertase Pin-like site-specific DNA recombinase